MKKKKYFFSQARSGNLNYKLLMSLLKSNLIVSVKSKLIAPKKLVAKYTGFSNPIA